MHMIELNVDYDPLGDSLFVWSQKDYQYDYSFVIDEDIVIDMDENGLPVAFEFLNASYWFEITKAALRSISGIP